MRTALTFAAALIFFIVPHVAHAERSPSAEAPNQSVEQPQGRLTGFAFELDMGFRYLGGHFVDGVQVGSLETTMALEVGAYVTRHVGILGGVEGGLGFWTESCNTPTRQGPDGKEEAACLSGSVRLPLLVQYAFADRAKGLYLEGGAKLFNIFKGVSDYTISMMSPVDLTAGIGFRFPTEGNSSGLLRISADLGRFESGSINDRDVDTAAAGRALHYTLTLGGGFSF